MTSSPGPASRARSARWRATVPLATAIAALVPANAANSRSKRSTYGPVDEIQELRMASRTYCSSLPLRSGAAAGSLSTSCSKCAIEDLEIRGRHTVPGDPADRAPQSLDTLGPQGRAVDDIGQLGGDISRAARVEERRLDAERVGVLAERGDVPARDRRPQAPRVQPGPVPALVERGVDGDRGADDQLVDRLVGDVAQADDVTCPVRPDRPDRRGGAGRLLGPGAGDDEAQVAVRLAQDGERRDHRPDVLVGRDVVRAQDVRPPRIQPQRRNGCLVAAHVRAGKRREPDDARGRLARVEPGDLTRHEVTGRDDGGDREPGVELLVQGAGNRRSEDLRAEEVLEIEVVEGEPHV